MKKVTLLVFLFAMTLSIYGAENITGLWKSIDDETGNVRTVTLIYEYEGKVFGRILVTYDDDGNLFDSIMAPQDKAVNIEGEPYFSGLDFIWNLEDNGKKWSSGKIIDPKPAKIYSCDIWRDGEKLIVRGKVGPFGRNQTWLPINSEAELPEGLIVPENIQPTIPKVK